jgi:hypothetical protein
MNADWLILITSCMRGAKRNAMVFENSLPTEWIRLMG